MRATVLLVLVLLLRSVTSQDVGTSTSSSFSLVAEDFCVSRQILPLVAGCSASQQANGSLLPLWGALVNVTRDCGLDPTPGGNHSSYDSYGLGPWLAGVQSVFQQYVYEFNAQSGLTNWYRNRTIGDYISNWVQMWPTPDNPGPNDWWMLGSEVFGEDLDHGGSWT
ncbi:hypothetical protein HYH03_019143 [Edaphochlamys debaryana]|uniref:Uncharacterized protein n=1 Tax=Edaphochlamys debaryana TaxID=47281 RepID=A0A836BNN2_9CHLO|nr:hypothetical protein HYH03_019143 [Edaphochlamys debaryana]|eukprot:KAG2481899.1 hypothetical protein HYH03_019143 [Edaphochlamys debaryana]